MNGDLIDTNVIIRVLNGDQQAVELFDSLESIHISAITVGELMYGAYKSSKTQDNIKLFDEFLSEYTIIGIDENVSRIYGKTKAELVLKGVNIPENEIWIAATANHNNLRIISYDEHFSCFSE